MAIAAIVRRNTEKTEGVRSEWRVVSPDLATKWLEGNTHNRPVRDSVVHRYAADMQAGRWKQSHQGIAFDEEGTLIDGQHRLFAVIEASTPVLMQVTYGLSMDTQMVVDDGIKRTTVDLLKINGKGLDTLKKIHGAVGNAMRYGLAARSSHVLTRQDEAEFIVKHWEAIDFAVSHIKKIPKLASAPVLAAVARAYYHEDEAVLVRFLEVLETGIIQKDVESTVIILRNWLLSKGGMNGSASRVEVYGKAMRAIVAFVKGKQIPTGRLYAVTEEPYALPGKGKLAK